MLWHNLFIYSFQLIIMNSGARDLVLLMKFAHESSRGLTLGFTMEHQTVIRGFSVWFGILPLRQVRVFIHIYAFKLLTLDIGLQFLVSDWRLRFRSLVLSEFVVNVKLWLQLTHSLVQRGSLNLFLSCHSFFAKGKRSLPRLSNRRFAHIIFHRWIMVYS